MKIAIGDEVRVHYHPPGQAMSFVEGVVSRTDVPTLRGQVFVIDVTYEVLLDREQRIRPGYQNYILYERWEDFPGRIEVLSNSARAQDSAPAPAPEPAEGQVNEKMGLQVEIQRRDSQSPSNVIAAMFRRQR